MTSRTHDRWVLPAVLVSFVLPTAVLVGWLAAGRPADGGAWPVLAPGLAAVGVGALTPLFFRRRDTWRLVAAGAVASWGLGTVGLGAVVALADRPPDVRASLLTVAVPLGLVVVVLVPRVVLRGRRTGLVVLEAACLAVGGGAFAWWVLLEPGRGPVPTAATVGVVAFVVEELLITAVVLRIWLTDLAPGALPAVAGLALNALAHVVVVLTPSDGTTWSWHAALLWVYAWPLVGVTLVHYDPPGPQAATIAAERRDGWSTHVVSGLAVVLIIAGLVVDGHVGPDPIGTSLVVLLTAAVGAREVLATRVRVRLVETLFHAAEHDPLTGLANRRALTTRIADLDPLRGAVVLSLDLDGFKGVNDVLGHGAGDTLLAEVGHVLAATCPPQALVARVGGDEFAVLLEGDLEDGRELAERLRVAVRACLEGPGARSAVSVSIGVGLLDTSSRAQRLDGLAEAAEALRAAKRAGKDVVRVYAGEIAADRDRRLLLEERLRRALADHRLTVAAQPLVDLADGSVRGVEALARWHDDVLGDVPPGEFVRVAEDSGLVVPLGEAVLRAAVEEAERHGLLAAGRFVSVNVSPVQLRSPSFVPCVRDVVRRHLPDPSLLVLEITEAVLLDATGPGAVAVVELAGLGVRVAIDDFGAGYSSIGYLLRLPLHGLKVDRSLVTAAVRDTRAREVVRSVVELAHALSLDVVVEGVEDERTAAVCRELGADVGQGWAFGRPGPWELVRPVEAVRPTPPPAPGPSRTAPAATGRR